MKKNKLDKKDISLKYLAGPVNRDRFDKKKKTTNSKLKEIIRQEIKKMVKADENKIGFNHFKDRNTD